MGGFWSRLFKGGDPPRDPGNGYPDVDEGYLKRREQALGLDARSFPGSAEFGGLAAILMETGYPEAVATLTVVADGSVSLQFSQGGGLMGMGEHDGPRHAGRALLAAAGPARQACVRATAHPLPRDGHTHFYLVTADGVLTGGASDDDLVMGRHPLTPLFHAGQRVLTECRRVEEMRGRSS